MSMFLKQHGDKILFGTAAGEHADQAEDIDRFADRLLRMLDLARK